VAGRRKREVLREELLRRAVAELGEEATASDYVIHWTANARTLYELAAELSKASIYEFFPQQIRNVCEAEESAPGEFKSRLDAARAIAAEHFVEESKSLADDVIPTKEHIAKAKLQISTRQWIAERYNRDAFGQPKTQVSISIGSLHLDSLRKAPPPPPTVTAGPAQPALPAAAEEAVDVEVL